MKKDKYYDKYYRIEQDDCDCATNAPYVEPLMNLFAIEFENGDTEFVVATNIHNALSRYECTLSNQGKVTAVNKVSDNVIVVR